MHRKALPDSLTDWGQFRVTESFQRQCDRTPLGTPHTCRYVYKNNPLLQSSYNYVDFFCHFSVYLVMWVSHPHLNLLKGIKTPESKKSKIGSL